MQVTKDKLEETPVLSVTLVTAVVMDLGDVMAAQAAAVVVVDTIQTTNVAKVHMVAIVQQINHHMVVCIPLDTAAVVDIMLMVLVAAVALEVLVFHQLLVAETVKVDHTFNWWVVSLQVAVVLVPTVVSTTFPCQVVAVVLNLDEQKTNKLLMQVLMDLVAAVVVTQLVVMVDMVLMALLLSECTQQEKLALKSHLHISLLKDSL
jgi:hypothetical protein